VPAQDRQGAALRVPHVGWRGLLPTPGRSDWAGTVLEATAEGEPMYFVHSYAPVPLHPRHRLADMHYGGMPLCAAVMRDNVVGCQFHPERSGVAGLAILRHFLTL
jgi:imidazole glycerol-phosphate synthase subunit HisH